MKKKCINCDAPIKRRNHKFCTNTCASAFAEAAVDNEEYCVTHEHWTDNWQGSSMDCCGFCDSEEDCDCQFLCNPRGVSK